MTFSEKTLKRLDQLDIFLSVLVTIWAFSAADFEPWVAVLIIVIMGLLLSGLPRLINVMARGKQGVRMK